VIGTLAREAAEQRARGLHRLRRQGHDAVGHAAVKILNPQKDNLILDPAKVTETLGVPPEKVVDVMALRGDAVDNIPGAPGIGDKGSVELIVEFGSVEAVLDRAAEVKRKSYRESLEQNRDAVLLSKELVTIDSHVPLALDLAAMETQPPDLEACRELFTELEFTSMLRDLAPSAAAPAVELIEEPTPSRPPRSTPRRAHGFAFALDAAAPPAKPGTEDEAPQRCRCWMWPKPPKSRPASAWASAPSLRCALRLPLTPELRALLEDAAVPKRKRTTGSWLCIC
jgi:DNA polymerase-1